MSSSSCLISSRNSYSSFIVPKPCSRELFWPGVRTLVLTCPSSGCAVMSASKVSDLNGLLLQVTILTTGTILPVSGSIKSSSIKGVIGQTFGFSQRELELGEGIVHVRRRGQVSVELILGPVVPARGDPPRATTDRFILGEIELPELVRAGRLLRERGLATLGELAALTLVVGRQDQSLIAQHPQHSRLRYPVPIMTGHRPDLPMPPRRMSRGVLHCEAPGGIARAAATAPSESARRVLSLASAARSVRAYRIVHRTSRSTCPTQCGSPRGPRRAQAALRTLLPHPDLDRSLTQRLGQLRNLSLQLLLPRRGPGLTRNQTGLASVEELALPVPDRLPRHLLPTSGLSNQHLTLKHRQHDADLLLRRDPRWTTHDDSNLSTGALQQQPTTPATKPDARHHLPAAFTTPTRTTTRTPPPPKPKTWNRSNWNQKRGAGHSVPTAAIASTSLPVRPVRTGCMRSILRTTGRRWPRCESRNWWRESQRS